MSDGSFLQWPFFSDEHRELAARLDDWANRQIPLSQQKSITI